MIEIKKVHDDSIASELGLQPGDQVVSVNQHPINDEIDFRFYSAEEKIELLIQKEYTQTLFEIEKDHHEDIGIVFLEKNLRYSYKCYLKSYPFS